MGSARNGRVQECEASDEPRRERCEPHFQAVVRVIRAVRKMSGECLRLRDMAKIAFISPFHFDRVFRHVVGVPPRQFQAAIRMEEAKRLILTSNMSALDVCLQVGYSSLGTFTRRFGEMVGQTPIAMRRLLKESSPHVPRPALENESIASGTITGHLAFPPAFDGIAMAGLFPTPIPQGIPLACTSTRPGETSFKLRGVPNGQYFVLVAAISHPADAMSILLNDVAAVGRSAVRVTGGIAEDLHIVLRPPEITDPPILTAIAPNFAQEFQRRSRIESVAETTSVA